MSASSSITPERSARPQPGAPERQRSGIDRGQPVHILARVDHRRQRGPVEVLGNGQLQQHPADGVVGVQALELLGHLLERRRRAEAPVERDHPHLKACALLAAHVHRGGRVFADEHRRQPGRAPGALDELLDLARDARRARGRRSPCRR